jgi:hypothetical protein
MTCGDACRPWWLTKIAARRHGTWLAAAALALAVGLTVAACSGPDGLGGMEMPRQRDGETYPGMRRDIVGIVEVTPDGCIGVKVDDRSYFAIWPRGSEQGEAVRLPGGEVIAAGDRIAGVGALTPVAPLVADPNGYWAYVIGFCAPGAREVLVLDAAGRG